MATLIASPATAQDDGPDIRVDPEDLPEPIEDALGCEKGFTHAGDNPDEGSQTGGATHSLGILVKHPCIPHVAAPLVPGVTTAGSMSPPGATQLVEGLSPCKKVDGGWFPGDDAWTYSDKVDAWTQTAFYDGRMPYIASVRIVFAIPIDSQSFAYSNTLDGPQAQQRCNVERAAAIAQAQAEAYAWLAEQFADSLVVDSWATVKLVPTTGGHLLVAGGWGTSTIEWDVVTSAWQFSSANTLERISGEEGSVAIAMYSDGHSLISDPSVV